MTTHVLLVSEQATANLLSTLDPAMKPDEAVLVVSAKMQRRAEDLEAVLHEAGVKVQRKRIENEHDYNELENRLGEIASRLEGRNVVLNATGGTKLMTLVAQATAALASWSMFYVDIDTDEVIWLDKDKKGQRQSLTAQLRLRHYLRGYGFTLPKGIRKPPANSNYTALLRPLVTQVGCLEKPLSQLNWFTQKVQEEKQLHVEREPKQSESMGLNALLRNFQDAGVLCVYGSKIHFVDEVE